MKELEEKLGALETELNQRDKNWHWTLRRDGTQILAQWAYLKDEGPFRINCLGPEEEWMVFNECGKDVTMELEDTLDLRSTVLSLYWYASSRY